MAEPPSDDSVLWKAVTGLALFIAGLVGWEHRRTAKREDRDAESRDAYLKTLAPLPGELATMKARVDAQDVEIADLRERVHECERHRK